MRNLKRVLSLALACVMVIGMMVMTTGAADIVDIDEVENVEAVAVMNALGVLEGDENGVFNPTGTLTRAQAAKIIAFVKLGSTNAKKLATTGVSFTDVAANHWAAPYIGYCASLNIIAGNGDGTFAPEGELTGLAFGKMLLVALGFDAARYTNNGDWATNIATDLIDADLNVDGVILTNPISRDNAAQMAFNALFYSEEVEEVTIYKLTVTKDTDQSMDNAKAGAYASFAEAYLVGKEAANDDDAWTPVSQTNTVFSDSLANEVFGLSYAGATDNFMSPATAYTSTLKAYKDVNDILVVDAPDYVIEGKILSKVLYSKVGYKAAGYSWTNYVDGAYTNTTAPASATATPFGATADGTVMYVYIDNANQTVTTSLINTYIGEVKKVTEAKDGVDRFVTLTNGMTFTTEDFAVKDTVLYTYSSKQVNAADAGIQSMELAQVVSGKLEKITNTGVYTVDGTDYVVAAKGASSLGTGNLGKTVSFYVDNYNNIMKDKGGAQAAATDYIFVLGNAACEATGYLGSTIYSAEVYGVLADGSVVTKNVESVGGTPFAAAGTPDLNVLSTKTTNNTGILYSYADADKDGLLELTVVDDVAWTSAIAAKETSADSNILNDATTFVFVETKNYKTDNTVKNVTVKVGNTNIGTGIAADTAFIGGKDGLAKVVFVAASYTDTSAETENVAYIDKSTETTETVSTGSGTATTYIYANAWNADGKLTITNKTTVAATGLYKLNEDGTVGTAISTTSGIIAAIDGNVVTIGDGSGNYTYLNLTDKTVEIFTGKDVELQVGQSIAYAKGANATANDLTYIVVTADQVTKTLTLDATAIDSTYDAVTTTYEVIAGTDVDNTVIVTITKDDGTAFAAATYTLTATGGTVDSDVTVTGNNTKSISFKISVDDVAANVTLALTGLS